MEKFLQVFRRIPPEFWSWPAPENRRQVRSHLMSTQSKRWERLKAAASKPHREKSLNAAFTRMGETKVKWSLGTIFATSEVTIDQLMEVKKTQSIHYKYIKRHVKKTRQII
ncbi:hypothetical protein H5410_054116 [Solanum commersonii]|uniref:Uncharacterized protein n=1 Tax=Solanum commersonii TaxID=4109 RepID=A0A9J5X5B7_SOLCO|nr:hypothetical protein H5410_054116 [Solanum commersonii]